MARRRSDRRGRRLLRQAGVAFAVFFLAIAVSVTTYAWYQLDQITATVDQMPDLEVDGVVTDVGFGEPQTIMLLGSDARWHQGSQMSGRSDTIILLRLDPDADVISVLSVPRDLKVQIRRPDGTRHTEKINAAYEHGGPKLAVSTVSDVLGVEINHAIEVSFRGFRAGVNALGCVYSDIDRRYFNPEGTGWAAIDLQAGYQKLCGADALDFVRFRHTDTDLVRAARQQAFLRSAKAQVSVHGLLDDRDRLMQLVARYARSDIRGRADVLELLRLAAGVAGKPVRQIPFPATLGPSYVEASPHAIRRTVSAFMRGRSVPAAAPPKKPSDGKKQPAAPVAGLTDARFDRVEARMKVRTPRKMVEGSSVLERRVYAISDHDGADQPAYRLVLSAPGGGYYGVQGTQWTEPPLLSQVTQTRSVNGRKLQLIFAGDRLATVLWQPSSGGSYWVQNTLTFDLSNRQMLAIAASLAPQS